MSIDELVKLAAKKKFDLQIEYVSWSSGLTKRKISNIRFSDNHAYIIAYCRLRKEDRTFKIERILEAEIAK
jgi:predicted DNA-binding transcriptional regulator YafY